MFLDFREIYGFGKAVWDGQYIGPYPYPTTLFFALFALLPYNYALALWITLSGVALVATFGRRAPYWVAFAPIVLTLAQGQVDLFLLFLMHTDEAPALGLMWLKPHVAVFALPKMLKKEKIWGVLAMVVILFGIPTIARPSWVFEWVERVIAQQESGVRLTTLIGYPIVALVIIILRKDWKTWWTVANPYCLFPYDLTLLAGRSVWLVPISWALFLLSIKINNPSIVALLGVFYSRTGAELEKITNCDKV